MGIKIRDIVRIVSHRTGEDKEYLASMIPEILEAVAYCLENGHDVKLRHLGAFSWAKRKASARRHPATKEMVEVREKYFLKFKPAVNLRSGPMCDEGMTKYGVEFDDKKKEASEGSRKGCSQCGKKTDDGGSCPEHGTEPDEKRD